MKVQVIGSGCAACKKLYADVKACLAENGIKAEVEYLKGIDELISRGIMGGPALLVDGKVVSVGIPKDLSKLLKK